MKSYLLIILAFVGGLQSCSEDVLTPTDTSLGVPELLFPVNDTLNTGSVVALRWKPAAKALSYKVELSIKEDFTALVDTVTVSTTVYTPTMLKQNTVYYWHVRAQDNTDTSVWSSTRKFTTGSFHGTAGIGSVYSYLAKDVTSGLEAEHSLTLIQKDFVFLGHNVRAFQTRFNGTLTDTIHYGFEPNGDITVMNYPFTTLNYGDREDVVTPPDTTDFEFEHINITNLSTEYEGAKTVSIGGRQYETLGITAKEVRERINTVTHQRTSTTRAYTYFYSPELGMFTSIIDRYVTSGKEEVYTVEMTGVSLK